MSHKMASRNWILLVFRIICFVADRSCFEGQSQSQLFFSNACVLGGDFLKQRKMLVFRVCLKCSCDFYELLNIRTVSDFHLPTAAESLGCETAWAYSALEFCWAILLYRAACRWVSRSTAADCRGTGTDCT